MLAMGYYVLRQTLGVQYGVGPFLIGVSLTFVAGYTMTGLFVYYLLWVAEREFPRHHQLDLRAEDASANTAESRPGSREENP